MAIDGLDCCTLSFGLEWLEWVLGCRPHWQLEHPRLHGQGVVDRVLDEWEEVHGFRTLRRYSSGVHRIAREVAHRHAVILDGLLILVLVRLHGTVVGRDNVCIKFGQASFGGASRRLKYFGRPSGDRFLK